MQSGHGKLLALLEEVPSAHGDGERVTIADIQEHFGRRSFGPFLLIAALPVMTPLVNIPGVASTMGIVIFLTSAQMLLGRQTVWLPGAIRRRSVRRARIMKAIVFARPVVRWLDRLIRRRLDFLTRPPLLYLVALVCAVLGFIMPFVEFIPATSAIPAVPVAAFGIGIATHDGAFVIFGFVALALMVLAVVALWLAIF